MASRSFARSARKPKLWLGTKAALRSVTLLITGCATTLAIFGAAPAIAATLIVEVRTNYRAQVDFDTVRTQVQNGVSGAVLYEDEAYFFAYESLFGGVRVAEFEVPSGEYRVVVDLRSEHGLRVATEPVRVEVGSAPAHVVTAILTREIRDVTKRDELLDDIDGDGLVNPGDTLRYTIEIPGPQTDGSFRDSPDHGAALITGSVKTSQGIVNRGNGENDRDVSVGLGPIAQGEVAVVSFDAVVLSPVVRNQGVLVVVDAGRVDRFQTDDPATAKSPDATFTAIGSVSNEECAAELADALEELDDITGDADADGIAAIRDDCPNTPTSQGVDARGCSLGEFCAGFAATNFLERLSCSLADWRDDEIQIFAADCRPRAGHCSAN